MRISFGEACKKLQEENNRLNEIIKNIDTEVDAILTVLSDVDGMCQEYYTDCAKYLDAAQKVVNDMAVTAMSVLHDGFYKDAYDHLEELKEYRLGARILLNEVSFQKELYIYSQYWGIERERYIVSCILQHLLDLNWFSKNLDSITIDDIKKRRLKREAPELERGVATVFGADLHIKTFVTDVSEFLKFYNNSDISTVPFPNEKSMFYFLKIRQYLTSKDGAMYVEGISIV